MKSWFILSKMSGSRAQNSRSTEESVELGDNGLILNEKLIPVELIQRILCYVDEKTLLKCQLVCKCWNEIMLDYVWRRKAELKIGCKIPVDTILKVKDFYLICSKNPFERNLVKNHSGKEKFKHWQITQNRGNRWVTECPAAGLPALPPEPELENNQHCFVTSFGECCKQYTVNLIEEGFTANILDQLQPSIEISEWYGARWDCSAVYGMHVILLNQSDQPLDEYLFEDILAGDRQNIWFQAKHEFKNYGKGLRKIRFIHRGRDRQFWAGHYGSKMAGACVKVKIPDAFRKLN